MKSLKIREMMQAKGLQDNPSELATLLGVSRSDAKGLLNDTIGMTSELAEKLCALGESSTFWMNGEDDLELEIVVEAQLEEEVLEAQEEDVVEAQLSEDDIADLEIDIE